MANQLSSGLSQSNRRRHLAMPGEDRHELASKLPGDVFPTSHPPCSGNVGASGKDNNRDESRLSNLPDDILLNIVERLDIADAARTSILSRGWRQIPAMLSRIVIKVDSFKPRHINMSILSSDDIVRANARMLEATRSILESRTASDVYTIRLMRLQFYLGDDSIPIGQTVANTIATHKVCLAEFTILTRVRIRCTNDDLLTHGSQFISFVDACPNAFGGLTRLNLERMRVGESEFPRVFSICKRLEHLSLYRCDMGSRSLLELEHLQLRKLELVACVFERVDLKWLPKLTALSFGYWISQDDPLSFGYVPLLQSVSITNIGFSSLEMVNLSQLLGKACSVSNLCLNFKCERIWVRPEGPKQLSMVFRKLRLVNLMNIPEECDLDWTMFILQGAPTLKELCITVQDHYCEMIRKESLRKLHALSEDKGVAAGWETWPSLGFKHSSLAVLRFFGFQAGDKFVSYIKSVVEAAVNLEVIYLHDKPLCRRCRRSARRSSMYPRTRKQRSSIRKEILSKAAATTCSPLRIHFRKRDEPEIFMHALLQEQGTVAASVSTE